MGQSTLSLDFYAVDQFVYFLGVGNSTVGKKWMAAAVGDPHLVVCAINLSLVRWTIHPMVRPPGFEDIPGKFRIVVHSDCRTGCSTSL